MHRIHLRIVLLSLGVLFGYGSALAHHGHHHDYRGHYGHRHDHCHEDRGCERDCR